MIILNDQLNVTVWHEFRHEKSDPIVGALYPKGMHRAIADGLEQHADFKVRIASPIHGTCADIRPKPVTPAVINSASEAAQTSTTAPTCSRRKPWRSTKAFCAPIARINDNDTRKP